ncbi:MAG: hypothetical protein JWP74_1131 [Marmoricola sp.]|nr:hypothetical protein [Marmoricola sp.]
MKKILFIAVAAVAGIFVRKKIDEGRNEQDLWQQATDPVTKA